MNNIEFSQIKSVTFQTASNNSIISLSDGQIFSAKLYENNEPAQNGVLDPILGLSSNQNQCLTCGNDFLKCPGHFGYIKSSEFLFHNGFFKKIIQILRVFCFNCGKLLSKIPDRPLLKTPLSFTKQQIHFKTLIKIIKEEKKCQHCGEEKPKVKRLAFGINKILVSFLVNQNPCNYLYSNIKNSLKETDQKNGKNIKHKKEFELTLAHIYSILKNINYFHWQYLLGNPQPPHPVNLITKFIPVPPLSIRPTVSMGLDKTNEDDLTIKLFEFLRQEQNILQSIQQGKDLIKIEEQKYLLQILYNQFINSDCSESNVQKGVSNNYKGILQRIKGKTGRFRGNLSGKRVEYSGRTVISPDPNLEIGQVGIPLLMAMNLTFPEYVTKKNMKILKNYIANGQKKYPGVNSIKTQQGVFVLKSEIVKAKFLNQLMEGDIVNRHLIDGDVILFNRQPSLHRQSIMAFQIKIHEDKTLKFNECVCSPFNADFDGDEMNIHVLQNLLSKAEAKILLNSENNLLNIKEGDANITLIQDFLTISFMITKKDQFYDRSQICQLLSTATNSEIRFELPLPTIIKPKELWTGKQLIECFLNPSKDFPKVNANLIQREKNYDSKQKKQNFDLKEGWVEFRNGKLISGRIGKSTLGGNKNGLIYQIIKKNNHKRASLFMGFMAKLSAKNIGNIGITFGIKDVTPNKEITHSNQQLFKIKNLESKKLIQKFLFKNGKEIQMNNLSFEERADLENEITQLLNAARDDAGKYLLESLSMHNQGYIMAVSGAKGSPLNICQMMSTVGQQTVMGKRIQNGFMQRTLPHFKKFSLSPQSKGFVENSFYTGLLPTEFFFHTMAGREGLIDTAVKTADTGYMQRKLMKVMEDLVIEYDYTVRNSDKKLVQFVYGEDGFDPQMVEDEKFPIKIEDFQFNDQNEQIVHEAEIVKEKENEQTFIKNFQFQELNDMFYSQWKKIYPTQKENQKFENNLHQLLEFYSQQHNTKQQNQEKINNLIQRLAKCLIQPGDAVGAITAQSLGEPCTQMTLKTFHFAGVASMNVTLGVPRIKEIFNATEQIKTPIIEINLMKKYDEIQAVFIKNQINAVYLEDILLRVLEIYDMNSFQLQLDFDLDLIRRSFLGVRQKVQYKKLSSQHHHQIILLILCFILKQVNKSLLNKIKKIVVFGLPTCQRAIINKNKDKGLNIFAEGTGFKKILKIPGIDFSTTKTNDIFEIHEVLGVEAARTVIIQEVQLIMSMYGIQIDYRHLSLLADTISYSGNLYGLNRYGIVKMKNSPLMLASFEQTGEILFDAAFFGAKEEFKGEKVSIGTGKFELIVQLIQ